MVHLAAVVVGERNGCEAGCIPAVQLPREPRARQWEPRSLRQTRCETRPSTGNIRRKGLSKERRPHTTTSHEARPRGAAASARGANTASCRYARGRVRIYLHSYRLVHSRRTSTRKHNIRSSLRAPRAPSQPQVTRFPAS
eukprot:2551026-Pyramimonas_sp.AAC.1